MFHCSSSGGGSDPLSVSKSDILRGIITEKLSTAAREILAVVERTVADYEQEASGFRQEIDRQRRQLELLQPQVRLHRRDVEAAERHKLTGNVSEKVGEGPEAIATPIHEDPKGPDHETSPRTGFSTVHNDRKRKRTGRSSQNHISLKVCFLEDSHIEVLSKTVFQKSPVSIVKCPRGLPEASFLDLLRSSFPRLAAGEPFDLLTSDRSWRLQPLATATPDEISRAGNPTLYVRLKKLEVKMEVGQHLLSESTSTKQGILNDDETGLHTSSFGDVIGSASQHQEQEAAQTNVASMGTQIVWNEMARLNAKEEQGSGPELGLNPDLSENRESELQISSSCSSSGSEEDSGSVTSMSKSDDLETEDDSSSDTDQTLDEAVGCNRDAVALPRRRTNKLTCIVCGMWYRQAGSLITHIWNHVNEPHGVCGGCGEKFGSVETLKEHLKTHKKGYSCWICGKFLLYSASFNSHIAKHMGLSKTQCDVCSKTFSTISALDGHRRKVHGKFLARAGENHGGARVEASTDCRGYTCKLCGETFCLEVSLRAHETIHAPGDWPIPSLICDETLQTQQNRASHMRNHGTDASFACNLCDMSFLSEETLRVHAIVHSDETPYKCFECGRCFKRLSYLVNHSKTHSSVKICAVSGQVCDGQEALEGHMGIHNGETPQEQPSPKSEARRSAAGISEMFTGALKRRTQ